MLRQRWVGLALVLAGGVALAGAPPAQADFGVAPTSIDLPISPGSTASGAFGVRLTGERRSRFVVEVQDVVQDANGDFGFGPPTRSRFSASTWVAVLPRSFTGAPSRRQPVDFQVRVPRGAEPGDHVTSLTVKRVPPRGQGAATAQAISMRLTVRVAGARHARAAIQSLDVPSIASGGPVNASVVVRNTGNVRLDFDRGNRGSLTIQDGKTAKATTDFAGQLFPGRARSFRTGWDGPPLAGHFDARAAVELGGGKQASRSEGFWVLPWREGGALLLVVLAAILIATGRRSHRRRTTAASGGDGE